MSKIEFQKDLANKILNDLKIIDPRAYLAGGAPRDWNFGEEANDLDFYYFTQASSIQESSAQLERFCPGVHISAESRGSMKLYEYMHGLRRIWNADSLVGQHIEYAWESLSDSKVPGKPVGLFIRDMIGSESRF